MAYLELEDIQGIVVRGYGGLDESCFMPFRVVDPPKAQAWLGSLAEQLNDGLGRPETTAVNVAFTAPGLKKFLDQESMLNFSEPFLEGMDTERRGRILGDTGEYAAVNWGWGNARNPVHLMLLLYGETPEDLSRLSKGFRDAQVANGVEEVLVEGMPLPLGLTLPGRKEHFGFRDGISQPGIIGLKNGERPENQVAAGEFLLGYTNEYGKYPISPGVPARKDPTRALAPTPAAPEDGTDADDKGGEEPGVWPRDFGRNGSYLVFRQLEQDVYGFWSFLGESVDRDDAATRVDSPNGGSGVTPSQVTGRDKEAKHAREMTRLAAKMVGRWPSGAPITKFPDGDIFARQQYLAFLLVETQSEQYRDEAREDTIQKELDAIDRYIDDDDFAYYENDRFGAQCPVGSHLRRSNPRDAFTDDREESAALTRRHRIIRRGRAYGEPSPSNWMHESGVIWADRLLKQPPADSKRGLHFLAFNADIGRQFEFIQDTWINDPKFLGLYADADPIVGDHRFKGLPEEGGTFTEQSQPVRHHTPGLRRFVKMKGGAYFFMPGIRAVRYLSGCALPVESGSSD